MDDAGFQSRCDRWRSVQEIKNIVVIFFPFDFFFFYSGNGTCKWEANNRMDGRPSPTEQRPTPLEVSFPNYRAATAFLLPPLFLLLIGEKEYSRRPHLLVFMRSWNNFIRQM